VKPSQKKVVAKDGQGAAGQTGQNTGPHRGAFNGKYYANVDGNVEEWDFSSDGSFMHTAIMPAVFGNTRRLQRGTYEIVNGTLILHTGKTVTNVNDNQPRPLGHGSVSVSGQNNTSSTERYPVQLLGTQGANGMVINGRKFNVRHIW
jgi:hypothetical protein